MAVEDEGRCNAIITLAANHRSAMSSVSGQDKYARSYARPFDKMEVLDGFGSAEPTSNELFFVFGHGASAVGPTTPVSSIQSSPDLEGAHHIS
jgi:hypothetical protein